MFLYGLKQANFGCVATWKTFDSNMQNTEVFQRVFGAFHLSIKGFNHYRPILSIDGIHLYEKYKDTLMITIGCDGNNKLFPLAFAITEGENINRLGWFLACIINRVTQRMSLCVISDIHPYIMVAMIDVHLGWNEPYAYHRICICHLASNLMNLFKDKILKNLVCRAALETKVRKFNKHMDTIGIINLEAQRWLEAIPLKKLALSHDGGRRYGIMTINMSEVFNSVLKRAWSLPVTTLV